jgi:hypothetical protein
MNYAMFTPEGNAAVGSIVENALKNQLSWAEVYRKLAVLAKYDRERYGEAMDTAVRECVYNAIGAYNRDEEFYV